MGWETANIHLGTKNSRKPILIHMQKQKAKWLHGATEEMAMAVRADWKTWKKDGYA
jgi:predicted alpha/beta hydrolase